MTQCAASLVPALPVHEGTRTCGFMHAACALRSGRLVPQQNARRRARLRRERRKRRAGEELPHRGREPGGRLGNAAAGCDESALRAPMTRPGRAVYDSRAKLRSAVQKLERHAGQFETARRSPLVPRRVEYRIASGRVRSAGPHRVLTEPLETRGGDPSGPLPHPHQAGGRRSAVGTGRRRAGAQQERRRGAPVGGSCRLRPGSADGRSLP